MLKLAPSFEVRSIYGVSLSNISTSACLLHFLPLFCAFLVDLVFLLWFFLDLFLGLALFELPDSYCLLWDLLIFFLGATLLFWLLGESAHGGTLVLDISIYSFFKFYESMYWAPVLALDWFTWPVPGSCCEIWGFCIWIKCKWAND